MVNIETLTRQCILARKEYIPGKPVEEVQRELGLSDIIKLASNENPLGTSPLALAAMMRELQNNANRYPESHCHDLTARLAEVLKVAEDQIFIDNGLDGVITMLGLTFIDPGDEVVFGALTFPAYENITAKMDGRCIVAPLTADYRLDIDALIAAITPRTKLIFLCNPNNPTGTIVTREEYGRLLGALPETVLLISDEAYYDFADDLRYPNGLEYLAQHPNLVVLRTFSKVMGLAGLRVGYAVANPAVVKAMLKAREPFPVNRIAQAGALAALDDVDFVRRTLAVNREGRSFLTEALQVMGLKAVPSQTNFIFVDVGQPAEPVFQAMLREGVIVRPVNSPGERSFLRITIGTREENVRTLGALAKAVGAEIPGIPE
jgi:histidinol-phosphate aminotransferase